MMLNHMFSKQTNRISGEVVNVKWGFTQNYRRIHTKRNTRLKHKSHGTLILIGVEMFYTKTCINVLFQYENVSRRRSAKAGGCVSFMLVRLMLRMGMCV